MDRRVLVTAAVLGAVLLGITTASASQLNIFGPSSVASDSATPCTTAALDVVAGNRAGNSDNYRNITIGSVPSACAGFSLSYVLYTSTGAVVHSGSLTAAAGNNVVVLPTFNGPSVEGASLLIDGWPISSNWSLGAPTNPTPAVGPVTCYRLNDQGNVLTDSAGMGLQCANTPGVGLNTWVAGYDTTAVGNMQVNWSITATDPYVLLVFNFADPLYNAYTGSTVTSWMTMTSNWGVSQLRPGYSCTSRPIVEIRVQHPNTSWGEQNLSGMLHFATAPLTGAVCTG